MPKTRLSDKSYSIISSDAYKHYKEKSKVKDKVTASEYKQVVKSIYKKVGEHLIENTSGVYMDKLGYFCIVMNPVRKLPPTIIKIYPQTVNRIYTPILFTDSSKGYTFSGWSMDRSFNSRNIKRKLKDKLVSGLKYKFEHTLIKSFGKSK